MVAAQCLVFQYLQQRIDDDCLEVVIGGDGRTMLRQRDLVYGRQRGFNDAFILGSALDKHSVPVTQIICKLPFVGRDPVLPIFLAPSPLHV